MESAATAQAYKDGLSEFKNNIVAVYTKPYNVQDDGAKTVFATNDALQAKAEAEGNRTLASRDAVQLTDPFNLTSPNFLPKAGSPALTGASFTGMDSFFSTTTYVGAFGTTNWTQGWASFNPRSNSY
jgi:hypothetical protein